MRWGLLLFLTCWCQPVGAELAWPGKTGPTFNGQARESDSKGVPIRWDEGRGEHVAWKVPLAQLGHSTPVIGEGRIWLTAATEDGTRQYVICVREDDGRVLHERLLFENVDPEPLGNPVNSYASPTCLLTKDAVYVHFGTYGTAKLDPRTAETLWERRDINVRHFRGPGSSPVLHDDLLILTFDGIDRQFLTALDIATGSTVWLTERTTDYGDLDPDGKPHREGDLRKAFSTPALANVHGQVQVISVGSRAAFGYDVRTGKELWTVTHDDYNAAAQPLLAGNTVILNTGSRNANLLAVRLDETTLGDVTASHVVWDRPKGNSRLCFPVFKDGRVYSLADNGVLTCVDADSGEEIFAGRVGGNFVASPVIAGDRLYVCDDRGVTTVLDAGTEFKILAKNRLDAGGKSSPAISRGALFLRTTGHLYKLAPSR